MTTSSQHINGAASNASSGLAGLFTDLDPLGTGKSKPYMDKKDFFSAEKMATSPKLTGRKASNAGLNASLTSPSATGAETIAGTSTVAFGSTNSPVPSLDVLSNSVGSDQGPRIFLSQNAITTGPLTQKATPNTQTQTAAAHKPRKRTPSNVSNSSASYVPYDQTPRMSNPTPPPRTAASNSNEAPSLAVSSRDTVTTSTNEGYNLNHHMPQSNFPHFQGLSHIRGPIEGFGFSSHLLGHSDVKENVVDKSCNNVIQNSNLSNNNNTNINNNKSNTNSSASIGTTVSHCVSSTQNNPEYISTKRGSANRRAHVSSQALHQNQRMTKVSSLETKGGSKAASEHSNASIWYGGSQDYGSSPPLSNVATTIPSSYMFPCPSSNQNIVQQQQQAQQLYLSQCSSNRPSSSSGVSSGYMTAGGDNGCLKVSLPPENHLSSHSGVDVIPRIGIDDSIGDGNYTESSYGSIPHLEASPRRYRTHGEDEFQYDVSATSLNVPTFINKSLENEKKSSLKRSESPPKLPERTPKNCIHSSISPPPLPPKKQTSNLTPMLPCVVTERKEEVKNILPNIDPEALNQHPMEDDIYDFPPDPTISGAGILNQKDDKTCVTEILKGKGSFKLKNAKHEYNKECKQETLRPDSVEFSTVTVEELSKMSVMELNEKMMSGHLPSHLKGMSIFELVEYIAKLMTCAQIANITNSIPIDSDKTNKTLLPSGCSNFTQENSIKPSFSDNFISHDDPESAASPSKDHPSSLRRYGIPSPINRFRTADSIHSMSPGPPTTGARISVSDEDGSEHKNNFEFPSATTQANQDINEEIPSSQPPFEETENTTEYLQNKKEKYEQEKSKGDEEEHYDKYAAFRDLELEEVQGWSTQSNREDTPDMEINIDPGPSSNCTDMAEDFNPGETENEETTEITFRQYTLSESKGNNPEIGAIQDEEPKEQVVCSSEGSLCSRSEELGPLKNNLASDEHRLDMFPAGDKHTFHIGEIQKDFGTHDVKRDSELPIYNISDDQHEPQEEGLEDGDVNGVKENYVKDESFTSFDDSLASNTSKVDEISKESLKERFFSSKVEEPVTTRQWTTFDETEPWNPSSTNEGRRSSLHYADDHNKAFSNLSGHHVIPQEINNVYNNRTNSTSRTSYSATLGRKPITHRRQVYSVNPVNNCSPSMTPQNTNIHSQRNRFPITGRETQNIFLAERNQDGINKMQLYFESRGMMPIDQKGVSQIASSHRRFNVEERNDSSSEPTITSEASRISSSVWPNNRPQHSNTPSVDGTRNIRNDTRMNNVDERVDLRGTPNPFNDNFNDNFGDKSMVQQVIHGANGRVPTQQIPQTLHSSSALHMEEAYLQQVSPVYLHHHPNSYLSDSETFQYCENYSESPRNRGSSNFQKHRYVEGASDGNSIHHEASMEDAQQLSVEQHVFSQEHNHEYHQRHESISSQPGSISSHNEIPLSSGSMEASSWKGNTRHSSVASCSSHDNNPTQPTTLPNTKNDDLFRVDESSLENPTFKVHAKVIPGAMRSESTNLDENNDTEKFDFENDAFSVPKSDSINIFSIKSDPFDDEFFQF